MSPWRKEKLLQLLSGPLAFIVCLLFELDNEYAVMVRMLAVASWMLVWWMTEVVSLSITALLPLILMPMLGIQTLSDVSALYTHPIVFLFFGGFLLALGIEKWNLHRRIALNILLKTGSKPRNVLLGILLATGLLSMWISNTATAVMMFPIALSIARIYKQRDQDTNRYDLIFLLAVAYGANIGGIATLIGTPPNVILAGFYNDTFKMEISFAEWLSIGFPLSIILGSGVFFYMAFFLPKGKGDESQELYIRSELAALGHLSIAEKRFLIVFIATALSWIFRPQIISLFNLQGFSDTTIALIGGILLFLTPSGNRDEPVLLQWKDTVKLPWGILLLFGGGLSLAGGLQHTGIVGLLGNYLIALDATTWFVIILAVTFIGVFATEFVSNMALTAAMMALIAVVSESLQIPFLVLAIPLTIGASCAFMFPMATPPNAIIFAAGTIKIRQMAAIGIILNVGSVILISVFIYFIRNYIGGM